MIKRCVVISLFFAFHIFLIRSCEDWNKSKRLYIESYKTSMKCEHVGYKGRGEEKLYKCGVTGMLKTEAEM
jgi:hypothetical protein